MEIAKHLIILSIFTTHLFAETPQWISNQSIDGYICGIGISNEKNKSMRERIAIVSARANLAENISVEIMSYFKIHTRVVNNEMNQMSESIIEQKAHQMLSRSKIEKRFVDTDGTLYILIILPQTLQQLVK